MGKNLKISLALAGNLIFAIRMAFSSYKKCEFNGILY